MIAPGTLFEELGFHYFGPIDGHDLKVLIPMLQNLKLLKGPQLLHVITTKGKGYPPAEKDPVKYHAVKIGFNTKNTESGATAKKPKPTYSDIFGQWLCDMAKNDPYLMAITPAMCEGSGMTHFAEKYPHQYFDVGIAEQHSVTFAAGLACEGLKPIVAIYSTFLQRGYDQLIHDVALQNLDVTFAIDRGGLVGADGPTHAGSFDLSYLRCIPNLIIMTPSDENECRQMLYTAYRYQGPAAVRYPRGHGPGTEIKEIMEEIPVGRALIRRSGKDIAILSFGSLLKQALTVAVELDATVVDMRFVKPLDIELICKLAKSHQLLVTLEENSVLGGAGSGVSEALQAANLVCPLLILGLPDLFLEHGIPEQMLTNCGLSADGILQSIQKKWQHLSLKQQKSDLLTT
jgi:1-deoxy-D-xylulose-5-phosphate synthase